MEAASDRHEVPRHLDSPEMIGALSRPQVERLVVATGAAVLLWLPLHSFDTWLTLGAVAVCGGCPVRFLARPTHTTRLAPGVAGVRHLAPPRRPTLEPSASDAHRSGCRSQRGAAQSAPGWCRRSRRGHATVHRLSQRPSASARESAAQRSTPTYLHVIREAPRHVETPHTLASTAVSARHAAPGPVPSATRLLHQLGYDRVVAALGPVTADAADQNLTQGGPPLVQRL